MNHDDEQEKQLRQQLASLQVKGFESGFFADRVMQQLQRETDSGFLSGLHEELQRMFFRVSLPAAAFALVLGAVNLMIYSTPDLTVSGFVDALLGIRGLESDLLFTI
ncbi:hypothetical protein [Spongorhabdus nitratireducens]